MRPERETSRRRRAQRLGHWAEWFAALLLLAKAYRIIAIRYRTPVGEIDLIARKGDLVVMVEVKARKTVQEAVDAVGWRSQSRIRDAADLWIGRQTTAAPFSVRFDIVAVCPWRWPIHFRDAF